MKWVAAQSMHTRGVACKDRESPRCRTVDEIDDERVRDAHDTFRRRLIVSRGSSVVSVGGYCSGSQTPDLTGMGYEGAER